MGMLHYIGNVSYSGTTYVGLNFLQPSVLPGRLN